MRPEFQTETEIKLSEAKAAAADCNRAKVTVYIHMVLERLREKGQGSRNLSK